MGIRSYFIQYRFIIPESVKHSSYTYQKLFRAIYGYTQAVYKANGKVYRYHRPGILSNYPDIRPGKNCVIIPPAAFQPLQGFFETGANPTHKWRSKGEWKCTYFLNEKDVDAKQIISSVEELLSRKFINGDDGPASLLGEMKKVRDKGADAGYRSSIAREAQKIADLTWFKETFSQSRQLSDFNSLYKSLKK